MLRSLLLLLLTGFFTTAIAQTATVSGYVRDAQNGEPLIQATIVSSLAGSGTVGTVTNRYGYYSFYASGYRFAPATLLLRRLRSADVAPRIAAGYGGERRTHR